MGGKILESIGGFFKASKVAKKNIAYALPNLSSKEQDRIVKSVWNNLGRVFAEFPHITRLDKKSFDKLVEFEGEDKLEEFFESQQSVILFSAHYSNWEIVSKYFALRDKKLNILYRAANNRLVSDKVVKMRVGDSEVKMYKKGMVGAGRAVRSLLKGEILASFVDQKLAEGIDVPFFGRDAKTAPLIANLALKHDIPLLPLHIERNGSKFKFIIEDPIYVKEKKLKSDYEVMLTVNKIMEKWIKDKPEEWFWVHNRWPA